MDASDDGLLGGGDVRALATELGIRPTKRLGQNFVTDPNTVRRIVRAARLSDDDVVLEVGPGLGSLTLALLPHARAVIAVEIDPVLAGRLPATVASRLPQFADRLEVVTADAMRMPQLSQEPTALVANLPYNIAVPVVLHLLQAVPSIDTVLVMVQKEVADRLAAAPGQQGLRDPQRQGALVLRRRGRRQHRHLGVLAGAARRVRPGPDDPSRAAGVERRARGDVRRRRRGLLPAPQDPPVRAGVAGRVARASPRGRSSRRESTRRCGASSSTWPPSRGSPMPSRSSATALRPANPHSLHGWGCRPSPSGSRPR